jgi:hypothetical protein
LYGNFTADKSVLQYNGISGFGLPDFRLFLVSPLLVVGQKQKTENSDFGFEILGRNFHQKLTSIECGMPPLSPQPSAAAFCIFIIDNG